MLLLALAGWIYGSANRGWWAALVALAVIIAGSWLFLGEAMSKSARGADAIQANSVGIAWEPFSPERIESARKEGRPVFIDFTAGWCINCKVNEGAVLNTQAVAAAFKEKNVITIRADWTDFDPVIGQWLKKFDRIGVPLYVLYVPGDEAPVVFPELLTKKLVLDAVAALATPK
jgi:thiol:disulfide interchange protein DsbD